MKLSYLVRGLPGHPIHPPLTDATIGAYTASAVMGFASIVGVAEKTSAHGWWLAMVVGLLFTAPTAVTGLIDWLTIQWRSPLWWTATYHMLSMLTATAFFVIAAVWGHGQYRHGIVETGPYILTLVGFGFLTLGGWLGGSVVFVHGMRVLNLVEEPTGRAVSPTPKPEKEMAEGA